jgi:ribosome biogenesis GTPase A
MTIQWFPGHMVAAQKKAAETMEFTDVVIEVLDARAPAASQNPMIKDLGAARQRANLKILNKSDLADPKITDQWIQYFNKLPKTKAIAISCKKVSDPKKILSACIDLVPHRGTTLKPLRMMIMGVPNVGKSTLMNAILNKRIAKVGDEPAITKQQQRHQINDYMILVDTPGMMWPKIINEKDGYLLAANNAIGKNAYQEEDVAIELGEILLKQYPELLRARFEVDSFINDPIELLEFIAKKKKSTQSIFGRPIDTYTIRDSQDDNVTLRIYYEGIEARARVSNGDNLDQLFELIFRDKTPAERATIKQKYATQGDVSEAKELIQAKAKDMLRHYIESILPGGFKAQVVTSSRRAAIRYQEAFALALKDLLQQIESQKSILQSLDEEAITQLSDELQFLAKTAKHH